MTDTVGLQWCLAIAAQMESILGGRTRSRPRSALAAVEELGGGWLGDRCPGWCLRVVRPC